MKILVSNDDGYRAEGIGRLRSALLPLGEVTVVAPDRNRSGASNSLTLDMPLRVHESEPGVHYVMGTPTDCVHLAISGLSLLGMSVPEFTVATLLVLAFAIRLNWFPAVVTAGPTATVGELLPAVWLPAAALTAVMAAYIIRMMRTSVIDVMSAEYVTLARVRGLSSARVLFRHALPNALLPTLNVIAINIAWLVGGVVVVESVFNYPGIGTLMIQAVHNRDLPVLQFIAVFGALTFVVCNLLADLAALWLNPRLRTPGRAG